MKLKDIKIGGIYKPTSERCAMFDFFKGVYIKITNIKNHNSLYYDILDKNKEVITSCDWCFTAEDLEPVTNRSSIGKKAYKTFLKNGGTRDSKGRFSKKQKIDWEKVYEDISDAYFSTGGSPGSRPELHTKAYFEVFKRHGLIKEGVEI